MYRKRPDLVVKYVAIPSEHATFLFPRIQQNPLFSEIQFVSFSKYKSNKKVWNKKNLVHVAKNIACE